jgi:hypothetical protein
MTGGVTARGSEASSLMSLFARLDFFYPRREVFWGFHPFEVCITKVCRFFGSECFLESSPSLRNPMRKD